MSKISWSTLFPLIGGFPLGAEKALKSLPELLYHITLQIIMTLFTLDI